MLFGLPLILKNEDCYRTQLAKRQATRFASGYIGGVAVSGGIGKVTNTIVGTLVIMSLTNGMNLLGIDISLQYIVKGLIFIIAVAFDVRTRLRR